MSATERLDLNARSHALRASLSVEMHLRRLPHFTTPARLMQIVTVLGEGGMAAADAHAAAIGELAGTPIAPRARYAQFTLDGVDVVWERHTEFATYTFIHQGAFETPFANAFGSVPHRIVADMPGEVIRATQIAVLGQGAPDPTTDELAAMFAMDGLIVCDVAGGIARVFSDFRLHADGFGWLIVADRGMAGEEAAQIVQRLQELGNYRNMALLGLPLAQTLTPQVTALEKRLAALTASMSERASEDETLLDELSYLSAELARIAAETRYRMSATRAYSTISAERLGQLAPIPVRGYQTLTDFTERRLMPAVRTCDSFTARLDDLSQRASWNSELLRTRIDTALARQNHELLASMNRRTQLQLRLQQAVEGLSVVAIAYYMVSLIAYVLDGIQGINKPLAMALIVPAVLIVVGVVARRVRATIKD